MNHEKSAATAAWQMMQRGTARRRAFVRSRRSNAATNRLHRLLMSCVVESDSDTIARLLISIQFILACVIVVMSDRLIQSPPPFWEIPVLRLPAVAWSGLVLAGLLWHVVAWREDRKCLRCYVVIYSCVVTIFLCGALFERGPGVATLMFVFNGWQIILAGRLWNDCADGEGND